MEKGKDTLEWMATNLQMIRLLTSRFDGFNEKSYQNTVLTIGVEGLRRALDVMEDELAAMKETSEAVQRG